MKLEELTPEQELLMDQVSKEWLDYFFSCNQSISQKEAEIKIEWLYEFCELDKPIIIFVDSPMEAQIGANYLKMLLEELEEELVGDKVGDKVWAKVGDKVRAKVGAKVGAKVRAKVGAKVRAKVGAKVGDKVRAKVWDKVGDKVGAKVGAKVWDKVWDKVGDKVGANQLDFFEFASYGSVWDYGWISFYDFFTRIGVLEDADYNTFQSLLQTGIYDMIQLNGFCIVSELPSKIHINAQDDLHCEDGPAIEFRDGYADYFWRGVSVPDSWITDKESITMDVIKQESNAERRRCLREIIGATKYYEILGGVDVLDEDIDNQGNPMRLLQTKSADDVTGEKIQFLECVCPSTKRMYNIYPPSQRVTNVWAAKADTFGKTERSFKPLIET